MKRSVLVILLALAIICPPVFGQGYPVIDPANLVQTTDIAATTAQHLSLLKILTTTITTINAVMTGMDKYKTTSIPPSFPDTQNYPYAKYFIAAMANGDERDELYRKTVTPMPKLEPILDALRLPNDARKGVEADYGGVQIFDTTIPRAVHQIGVIRRWPALTLAVAELIKDITSPRTLMHYNTASLEQSAAGIALLNRQAENQKQIASHELETIAAHSIARRNEMAKAVNFNLDIMENGARAAEAQIAGASDALANWSLR